MLITNDSAGGIRPAGKPDECFYCNRKVGEHHTDACVIPQKSVKVRFIYEITVEVPQNYTEADILFRFNEGTWCANNGLEELANCQEIKKHGCLCSTFKAEIVKEEGECTYEPKH